MINGSRGDLFSRRAKCRYCPRTYAFTTGRDKHMQAKHRNEMIRDGLIKLEPQELELESDYIAPVEATPITSPHGLGGDPFASTAGHICQDPEAHEKATKWDKLVELLPIMETYIKDYDKYQGGANV